MSLRARCRCEGKFRWFVMVLNVIALDLHVDDVFAHTNVRVNAKYKCKRGRRTSRDRFSMCMSSLSYIYVCLCAPAHKRTYARCLRMYGFEFERENFEAFFRSVT